jgi:hypothetical protein
VQTGRALCALIINRAFAAPDRHPRGLCFHPSCVVQGRACLFSMFSMVRASASYVSATFRRLALASVHLIDAARMRNSSALIR